MFPCLVSRSYLGVCLWTTLCETLCHAEALQAPSPPPIGVVEHHLGSRTDTRGRNDGTIPVPPCAAGTEEAEAVLTWMTAVLSYANVRRHKALHHQPYASTRGITTSWSITITSHRRGTCQRGAARPPRRDFITLSRTSANLQFNWSCTVTDHPRHIGTITTSAITPATPAASITFTINFIVLIVISLKIPNH